MKDNGKLLLIDSHSLGYRAFYALPLLATSTGIYTNAIYGFMTMLIPLLENEKPDYCIAVFDTPHITFRHQLYAEYKAQRERSPKEFSEQLPLLKEILTKGFRIPALELDGYEADDLIGTITNLAEQKGLRSIIVTGDGDLLQLVSRLTSVRLTRRGITDLHSYTPESILQKYGLTPEQLIDYKGLKGDPSDNIPGVPGIGDKTATRLLQEYGNLENILLHGHKIKGKRVGDNLKKYAKQALISKELATIKRDVPLDFSWNDCRLKKPDYKVLTSQFRELEFKRLLDKLPAVEDSSPVIEKTAFSNNRSIASLEALRHYCKKLEETGYLSFIYEKVYSANLQCFVGCLGLSTGEGDGCYLFFTPDAKKGTMPQAKVWQLLRPYLEDSDLLKYSHNLKPLYKQCKENGILLRNAVFDTYIAAYLLDPLEDEYTLEALMERYLDCRLFTKTSKHEQKDFPQRGALLAAASQALFPLKERLHSLLQERELDRLY
ncbi:MAG: DNA polymerase I, partial [Firmicutes bacterium]|nr:DNA polymerase I [Bacillota bacterium]